MAALDNQYPACEPVLLGIYTWDDKYALTTPMAPYIIHTAIIITQCRLVYNVKMPLDRFEGTLKLGQPDATTDLSSRLVKHNILAYQDFFFLISIF